MKPLMLDYKMKILYQKTEVLSWGPNQHCDDLDYNDKKILVILAGLNGGTSANYTKHAILQGTEKGFRTVVVNMRGIAGELTTTKYHNAASVNDIAEAIDHISNKYPDANLYGMGISIGANYLINYASLQNQKLKGVVSISNPFDLDKVTKNLSSPNGQYLSTWIIDNNFKQKLINNFMRNIDQIKKDENFDKIDLNQVKNCKNVRHFEQLLLPYYQFSSLEEYFQASSSVFKLDQIDIPVLFINSGDDPVSRKQFIPIKKIQQKDNFILMITKKGGHIDWFYSRKAKRWVYTPAFQYLNHIERRIQDDKPIEIMG